MRMTAEMKRREQAKQATRLDRVGEINCQLASEQCHVVLSSYGAGVNFVHLGYKLGEDEYLILKQLSDVEFDTMDLNDSTMARTLAIAMYEAISDVRPIIEKEVRERTQRNMRNALGIFS